MSSSIRACARLAALLLLTSVCSAQLSGDYIPPNKYIPPGPSKCAEDRIIINTNRQEITTTLTRVQYRTITVRSTIQKEVTRVQPTTVAQTVTETVTQPIAFTTTKTVTKLIYSTSTQVIGGRIKTTTRTEYVPVINTVERTSVVTQPRYVTQETVRYITEYSTKFVGTPPATPTVYVTVTSTLYGPPRIIVSTTVIPRYLTTTVQQPPVVRSVFNTQIVTVRRVVKSYGQDVQRTSTVRVPKVNYVTKTSYVTTTEQRVVRVTRTERNTKTDYITSTVVQPVNVVKTVTLTNTITRTSTAYVAQPVIVTTTRLIHNTVYGPNVVRTGVNTVTKQVSQQGPTTYVTSVSKVLQVNTLRVTETAVVPRYVDRTVQVKQPCGGYNYADRGNPLNI